MLQFKAKVVDECDLYTQVNKRFAILVVAIQCVQLYICYVCMYIIFVY